MISITQKVHFVTRDRRKRITREEPASPPERTGRIPRISKLMALAIRFDQLLREERVTGLSELAELAHVTQPRMTQIMNLNHLAPDIQEEVLHLPSVEDGRDPIHERKLRPVCAELGWDQQRVLWKRMQRDV